MRWRCARSAGPSGRPGRARVGGGPGGGAPPAGAGPRATGGPGGARAGGAGGGRAGGAGRSLIVVVRDAPRHPTARDLATRLLGARPDAVVVEMGLPVW